MKKPEPPSLPHPYDEIRLLLAHFCEQSVRVWIQDDGSLKLDGPPASLPVGVRKAILRQKQALRAYYREIPRGEWPSCFFGPEGQALSCIRGHPYDLRRREDGRFVCACYYDWSWREQKRIGKKGRTNDV